MRFTKMHGLGNDYIYVNGFEERVTHRPQLAIRLADRHFGIGSDGLIVIEPPGTPGADCRMEMYNADGSRAQMCGNGIRCVAKFVFDYGIAKKREIRIETDAGLKTVRVETGDDGTANQVEVNMGHPRLERASIPLRDGGDPASPVVNAPIDVLGRKFRMTAVSMGNPHAVIFLERSGITMPLGDLPLSEWGPCFERHPWFPERTNTEFVSARNRRELDFRVWERGSGETLACGTGACAAVVAGVLTGDLDREAVVHLRGGDLQIRWPEGEPVYMTGPAVEVFSGQVELT